MGREGRQVHHPSTRTARTLRNLPDRVSPLSMLGHSARGLRSRGFTLLEVLAALMIASILAAAALPTMSARRRDQRVQTLAQQYALFYREGRMRAMGRGTAHMVRFSSTVQPRGSAQLFEAVQAVAAGSTTSCANLPRVGVDSCGAVNWGVDAQSRLVATLDQREELFNEAYAQFFFNTNAATNVDVCFTPSGRSYIRNGVGTFGSFTAVQRIQVRRKVGGNFADLLARDVMLLPNGSTRVETLVLGS
ncbi:MAG: prepilin-type N-terminal cleavage/methylation domain-containing protein [Myxococcales bacterium]|nr:MAG: prepilin-type N-terminal cleavage/methylation domain-containing protein [Myxococcales bacterium]